MISDAINHINRIMLGERRREIAASRQRKQFEDLTASVDAAMLDYDEDGSAKNERALTSAADALKGHVLARLIECDGDASTLPLESTLADGQTVRDICADEIAAVLDVPKQAERLANAERYVIGTRARIEEARQNHIEPLERELAADLHEVENAKAKHAEAVRTLDALKRKHGIG